MRVSLKLLGGEKFGSLPGHPLEVLEHAPGPRIPPLDEAPLVLACAYRDSHDSHASVHDHESCILARVLC